LSRPTRIKTGSQNAPPPEHSDNSWLLLKRLLRDYVRPHVPKLILAVLCMILVAVTTAGNAWLLQPAIDEIFVKQSQTMLILVPIAILAISILRGLGTYAQSIIMSHVGQRIIADTQIKLYEHLIRSDLTRLNDIHTGRLISNFIFDAGQMREAVSRAITGIAKDLITAICLIAVMFYQDWQLALIVLFVIPLAGLVMRKVGRRARKAAKAMQHETGNLAAHLGDTLDSARVVKAFAREDHETNRARTVVENRLREIMRLARVRAVTSPLMEAIGGVAIAAAIYYGGLRGMAGEMSLGAFMSFLAALLMAYQPIKSLANLNAVMQEGFAAAERILGLLDVEPSIVDEPDAKPLATDRGVVELRNVSFSYGSDIAALSNIDLQVPAGATVALVGPSGSGKTTLLNLVPRFYQAQSGSITIDGQDINAVTLRSLREAIALVGQETVLFDDSIRANIAYGRLDASDDEIAAAADQAAADAFIRELPAGYDTRAGEDGVKLSGGQRQRIAIARAMLKDAPILLLDEATSALDSEAERKVQQALEKLSQNRTCLVIAHRLSTIMNADRIYVLDGGRIVESGKHKELLAAGGMYARLYHLQYAGQEAATEAVTEAATELGPQLATSLDAGAD
jgi:subfamily B ATP-binding cassette protein MsbA